MTQLVMPTGQRVPVMWTGPKAMYRVPDNGIICMYIQNKKKFSIPSTSFPNLSQKLNMT